MSSSLECGAAPWETSGAMSTSPAIVSIGEPLIEFNRPKEGDGRTWLQGFGGDSQNCRDRRGPPGRDRRLPHQPRPGLDGRRLPRPLEERRRRRLEGDRHPTAPTGVSFVTHGPAGHKFDYLRKNSAASLMKPARPAEGLHRRRPLPACSAIGQAISDDAPAPAMPRDRRRARRRREGLLRHQPAPAAVGPRDGARDTIHATIARCDIALPSLDDSQQLTGLDTADDIADFYLSSARRWWR